MELDASDLRNGLEFICGKWKAEYVVNAFSNDLARIPASEWKGDDGSDFSAVTFDFDEDHNVVMRDGNSGKEENGTWEQTSCGEYHYTLNGFLDVPEGIFRKNAETLLVQDGFLCFSIGFICVMLKKCEDGEITPVEDPLDAEMTSDDEKRLDIVGRYGVDKAMSMVDGSFGFFTRDEVKASLEKQLESGEIDEDEMSETLGIFDSVIEFTADHTVKTWMKLPEGVTEEEIAEAIASGDIAEAKDGYMLTELTEWKSLGGKYYYDSHEQGEVMGEVQSPWKEFAPDDDGGIPYASGFMKLKKI